MIYLGTILKCGEDDHVRCCGVSVSSVIGTTATAAPTLVKPTEAQTETITTDLEALEKTTIQSVLKTEKPNELIDSVDNTILSRANITSNLVEAKSIKSDSSNEQLNDNDEITTISNDVTTTPSQNDENNAVETADNANKLNRISEYVMAIFPSELSEEMKMKMYDGISGADLHLIYPKVMEQDASEIELNENSDISTTLANDIYTTDVPTTTIASDLRVISHTTDNNDFTTEKNDLTTTFKSIDTVPDLIIPDLVTSSSTNIEQRSKTHRFNIRSYQHLENMSTTPVPMSIRMDQIKMRLRRLYNKPRRVEAFKNSNEINTSPATIVNEKPNDILLVRSNATKVEAVAINLKHEEKIMELHETLSQIVKMPELSKMGSMPDGEQAKQQISGLENILKNIQRSNKHPLKVKSKENVLLFSRATKTKTTTEKPEELDVTTTPSEPTTKRYTRRRSSIMQFKNRTRGTTTTTETPSTEASKRNRYRRIHKFTTTTERIETTENQTSSKVSESENENVTEIIENTTTTQTPVRNRLSMQKFYAASPRRQKLSTTNIPKTNTQIDVESKNASINEPEKSTQNQRRYPAFYLRSKSSQKESTPIVKLDVEKQAELKSIDEIPINENVDEEGHAQ